MAITSTITLRGSVGWAGRNDPSDVRLIQTRLNALLRPPRVPLVVDGDSGPKTETMIFDFQKNVMGVARPDAKVDPNGATLRALNDPASQGKWAVSAIPPAAPPPPPAAVAPAINYPAGLSALQKQNLDLIVAAAQKSADPNALAVLALVLQDPKCAAFVYILNGVGVAQFAAEWATLFAKAAYFCRGASAAVGWILCFAVARDGKALLEAVSYLRKSAAFAVALDGVGKLGSAINIANVLICAMNVINHFNNRRYGPAIAEVYGTVMQIAVPWASAIDSLQTLAFAAAPQLKNDPSATWWFKLVNAINPIGAGKTAVDAAITIIATAVDSFRAGTFEPRELQMLVDRMKQTPMRLFVGWGEALGDYMGDQFGDFYYEHFLS